MKKYLLALILLFFTSLHLRAQHTDVEFFKSEYDYYTTIDIMRQAMQQLDMTIFAEINHYENGLQVGIESRPSFLFVFGNPQGGTLLMQSEPKIAFELPLRMLVVETNEGVEVGYLPPSVLKKRYNIQGRDQVFEAIHQTYNAIALSVMPSRH
jgi:uncharacterized protein (DUF302 family)